MKETAPQWIKRVLDEKGWDRKDCEIVTFRRANPGSELMSAAVVHLPTGTREVWNKEDPPK